jgi:hypothetical protein
MYYKKINCTLCLHYSTWKTTVDTVLPDFPPNVNFEAGISSTNLKSENKYV